MQRVEKAIEKIRRQEALSKRKGSAASPNRVSGGMCRRPNLLLKKQREDELLSSQTHESGAQPTSKAYSSFSTRRGSSNTDLAAVGLHKKMMVVRPRSKTPAIRSAKRPLQTQSNQEKRPAKESQAERAP